MLRSVSIFLAVCLIALASCEYFSFGYPDVGNQHTEMIYTTGGPLKMTNSSTWMMRLYPNPPGWKGGIAYKETPIVTAHNGFTSRFTYVPTMCQNGYPGDVGGVSFFLTTGNISAMSNIPIIDQYALNTLPNVFMAGYSLQFNEFLICNWTAPPSNTYLRTFCPRKVNLDPPYTCATLNSTSRDAAYEFTVIYDTKTLSIYVDEELKFSQPMKLDPVPYTIGFSANIGSLYNSVFRQEITYWNFTSLATPAVESFTYDARVTDPEEFAEQFRLFGLAQRKDSAVQMVPSLPHTVGALVHQGGVAAHRGFRTRFTWSPAECDGDNGYGDGFTFFLTRSLPAKNGVLSSFGNSLGIAKHDNTFAMGYSSFNNEFRKCRWTIPTVEWAGCMLKLSTNDPLDCNKDYIVDIHYDGKELKMYFDRELVLYDFTETIEPALYYVGLTASNGNSFFRQEIKDWSFDILNYNSGIDFPNITTAVASQFDFLGTALITPSSVLLTSTAQNQTGVIVHRNQFTSHAGFEVKFDWQNFAYVTANVRTGLTLFLSKTYPSASQVSASWNNYGIQTLPNTYAVVLPMVISIDSNGDYRTRITYSFCQWKAPNVSMSFFDDCVSDRTTSVLSGETKSFTVKYDGMTLEVFVGTSRVLDTPLTMDWDSYYIGLSASSNAGFGQKVFSLNFKTMQPSSVKRSFPSFSANDVSLYSDASLVTGILRLTPSNASTVGAAIHPNKILAHVGFQVKFSYTAQVCRKNGTTSGLPVGFSFFLAKNVPAADAVASSVNDGLGIKNVPNIGLMIGYLNQNSIFYVCSWDTPNTTVSFGRNRQCTQFSRYRNKQLCDVNYIYNIVYDGDFLMLFINNEQILMTKIKLPAMRYYAGFSATNEADEFGRQHINNWFYNYNTPPLRDQISFDFDTVEDMVLLGDAQVTNGRLVLTNSSNQAGAVFYPHLVRPNVGFNSSFTFLPINCDPVYNGADGFALFFSKQVPDESAILASGGGLLGVQNLPDVTMVAYSATYNEFFIANWTTPTTDSLRWFGQNIPNPLARVACNGVYRFAFIYDNNFRVYLNDMLVISTSIEFDPVGYYVGISGATGSGWFSQEFRTWRFNSYDLTP